MQDQFQFSSVTQSYLTLCGPTDCSMPGFPVHHQLLELAQTHVHRDRAVTISSLCHPFLLLPSIFPSIRGFSNESVLHIRWPKYWSFSVSISPSNEYSGLISFRIDWSDLLAVQETLRSLLQHHNSEASILQRSAFFMVQLSHLCMTTGKNHSFDCTCYMISLCDTWFSLSTVPKPDSVDYYYFQSLDNYLTLSHLSFLLSN